MKLNVLTPKDSFFEQDVLKIIAEGEKGYFCLLPNHVDYISTLKPGILSFEVVENKPIFMAVDEGVLVKKGEDVTLSVRNAFKGTILTGLKKFVEDEYENLDKEEKRSREILAKLEGDITKLIKEMR